MGYRKVSQSDIKGLLADYQAGLSQGEVAAKYGITRQRVQQLAVYYGVERRTVNELRIETISKAQDQIREWRNEGLSWIEIAKRLDVHTQTLREAIDTALFPRHGLKTGERWCPACKMVRLATEFSPHQGYCKPCTNGRTKKFYAERKAVSHEA